MTLSDCVFRIFAIPYERDLFARFRTSHMFYAVTYFVEFAFRMAGTN